MKTFALSKQLVIAYDNYNYQDTKRDQNLGSSHAEMVNLTTSILVCNPHLPVGGLQQSMLDLVAMQFLHHIHGKDIIKAKLPSVDRPRCQLRRRRTNDLISQFEACNLIFAQTRPWPTLRPVNYHFDIFLALRAVHA